MISIIGTLLKTDDFYGVSQEIETAKGKYKKPKKLKDVLKQAKRSIKWQLEK